MSAEVPMKTGKIVKNGLSCYLALPPQWIKNMKLEPGDEVDMLQASDDGHLIIRKKEA